MPTFTPGLVHTPVTPFMRDLQIDFGLYEKVLEFHLRNGAEGLALPMHAGESVSLSEDEQRKLLEFAIAHVKGRVPVIAHVSDAGTGIAADRARHAQDAGAAAVVATTPYYWTPPPAMLIKHFADRRRREHPVLPVLHARRTAWKQDHDRHSAETHRPAR